MTTSNTDPIKVGVITDLTGPLSFMGIANANVADMVVERPQRERRSARPPAPLDRRGQRHRRRAVRRPPPPRWSTSTTSTSSSAASTARHGRRSRAPWSSAARKLYIYPEQYEGQECDPLIFCTGPVPAQQIEPLIPWLMEQTGAKTFYLPSADYIWPHVLNAQGPRGRHRPRAARIVGEEYHPLDHLDYDATVERIMASGADVVFNTIVPPGLTPFLARLHDAGFTQRGGHIVCTYFDENFLNLVPAEQVEGLYGCLDYYRAVDDPFSTALARGVRPSLPGQRPVHRRQRLHGDVPRPRAVGGGRHRGRLPRHRRRGEGARHCEPRRGPGWSGGDGPRPAPPAAEHVHRAGHATVCSRSSRTSACVDPREAVVGEPATSCGGRLPSSREAAERRHRADPALVACEPPDKAEHMDHLPVLDYALGRLREVVGASTTRSSTPRRTARPGPYAGSPATR